MPIYAYRCPNGHTFEVFQRMADPPIGVCEVCGAGPVEKLLFPVAVHFKGKGFYSTDYGRGSRKESTDSEPAASKKESSSGDTGTGDKKAASGDSGGSSTTKEE